MVLTTLIHWMTHEIHGNVQGGGGFIGLWWLGGAPTAHEDLGQLDAGAKNGEVWGSGCGESLKA